MPLMKDHRPTLCGNLDGVGFKLGSSMSAEARRPLELPPPTDYPPARFEMLPLQRHLHLWKARPAGAKIAVTKFLTVIALRAIG